MKPITHKGYRLLHEGIIALSEVEAHGMRCDLKYLDSTLQSTKLRLAEVHREIQGFDEWRAWRRRFGSAASITSHQQLGVLLYDVLKYPITAWTGDEEGKGQPSTDVSALETINTPFIKKLIEYFKLDKAHGTYLTGIRREVVGDRIHPVFNLHTVLTYRSSSDNPNFQNMPVRDPEVAKLIRRIFIPSEGCVIVENDYAGVEVRVAACYHKDPVMLTYIKDPTKDMHRDMAAQLYMLTPDWVKAHGKKHRYGAKNKFVFPEFYGDFYVSCAKALWEWIDRGELKGPDGEPLKKHLATKGIKSLGACDPKLPPVKGTFEHHVKQVENDFWNERFGVYGKWKKTWYTDYLEEGGFDTLTGFRIEGVMRKNEVINYGVQGSAFHCLLWSLIQINKELKRRKMKSRVAGQIHDSIVGDVHVSELKQYLDIVKRIMTEDIRKAYPWLIVPLDIENEICPPWGSWYDKKQVGWNGLEFEYVNKADKKFHFEELDKLWQLMKEDAA